LRPPSCEAFRALRVPVMVVAGERTPVAIRATNEAVLVCLPSGTEYAKVAQAAH
jgi:hypothetical protein